MSKKEEVLEQLSTIIDPDLNQDIVTLGFIKKLTISDQNEVSFDIELTTPACPVKDMFKKTAETAVSTIDWVQCVKVTMTAQKPRKSTKTDNGLSSVKTIIGVSSCKGGVGKSTVAVNLAYTLSKLGAKVGVFDADIYGPSLDTLIKLPVEALGMKGKFVQPKEFHSVKLMSFGYTQSPYESSPAILRGPMVAQIINQLLLGTNWGELDYLIIDMPPGTGDIHITLAQIVQITASIIVTTPQELSLVDVIKGIQMFDSLKIPTVGVIENMSYFKCTNCDVNHYPFGSGAKTLLMNQFGFENTSELPIDSSITTACDEGVPYVLAYPESELTNSYTTFTKGLVREISKQTHHNQSIPTVGFDKKRGIVITNNEDDFVVLPHQLRLACECAYCIDEFTQENRMSTESKATDIYPVDIQTVGNYAIGISWSDSHTSLYPYKTILDLANPKKTQTV